MLLQASLQLLQEEPGQVRLLEPHHLCRHLGRKLGDSRLHGLHHEVFPILGPRGSLGFWSELCGRNEDVATSNLALSRPPHIHDGDACPILAGLDNQGIARAFLENGVLVAAQDHRHLPSQGGVLLYFQGERAIFLDELVRHGHEDVGLLPGSRLPSRQARIQEWEHCRTAFLRVDRLVSSAKTGHQHLSAADLENVVLG
mmetsp:Transcript_11906/g.28396  ORF Transcript_11906/g.28396 Transcript_11906/m.28396 type:complete len:200 (-) Transcript_11906:465-1064(-)